MGKHFLFPEGKFQESLPLPQAGTPSWFSAPSLAQDQETLQAVQRCLPKPAAFKQVWGSFWGLLVRGRHRLVSPLHAPQPLQGHYAGRPGAPDVGKGLAARPGWGGGWGPLFPSQGLQASRTEIQTSGFNSGMPSRAGAARGPQPEETRREHLDRSLKGAVSSTPSRSQKTRRKAVCRLRRLCG